MEIAPPNTEGFELFNLFDNRIKTLIFTISLILGCSGMGRGGIELGKDLEEIARNG